MSAVTTNNAQGILNAGITAVATTIVLTAGGGTPFPAPAAPDYAMLTLFNAGGTLEIVKLTSRAADTLTVVRGQEGTVGFAFAGADKIDCRLTAGVLTNKLDKDTGGTVVGNVSMTGVNNNILALAVGPSGTPAVKPIHSLGVATGEIQIQATQGLANSRAWNFLVDGGAGVAQNFTLRMTNDAGSATIVTALTVAGATGAVSFPALLTANAGLTVVGTATLAAVNISGLLSINAGANLTIAAVPGVKAVGYLGLPQTTRGGNYTATMADVASEQFFTATATGTIPTNAAVAFPIGTVIVWTADVGVVLSVALATDVMRFLPTNVVTTPRTVTGPGYLVATKKKSGEWWVTGVNVT